MQVLVIQVAVTEHLRLAEADTVNDACMNELVGDNQIPLSSQGRQYTDIGMVSGIEDQRGRLLIQLDKIFFQQPVIGMITRE